MSKIEIHKNDITNLKTEAIVNAANPQLAYGRGVCGSIFNAAGRELLEKELGSHAHCNVGEAVITPAFKLKNNKYIIHAVGPDCRIVQDGKEKLLYSAYISALQLAMDLNIKSIGFPLLSSGVYAYPEREAWEVALTACKDFIRQNSNYQITIVFVRRDRTEVNLGKAVLDEIESNDSTDPMLKMLMSIDQKKLSASIDYLKNVKEIKWTPNEEVDANGKKTLIMPYPIYDKEVFEIQTLINPKFNYSVKNYNTITKNNIVPSDMSIAEIYTCITAIYCGERFCEGNIGDAILDNTLLKLLLRIEDLLQKNGMLEI